MKPRGSDKYGYTAKIFEGEAHSDLKIEVGLPFADANPCAEEPIRRFYVSNDIGTRVSNYPMSQAVGKLLKILQHCIG